MSKMYFMQNEDCQCTVPQVLGYGGNSVHACGRLGEDHAVPKRPQALSGSHFRSILGVT